VRISQTFDADGQSVLQSACKMGLEGVIAKRLDAPYKGARTDAWLKVKCEHRQEFVVGGFVTRTGSTSEVGSLLLGVFDYTAVCDQLAAWERDGTRKLPRRCYARSGRSRSRSQPLIQSSLRPRVGGAGGAPAVSDGCGPLSSSR
jgi:ATP-dependent DNA ligase